MTNKEIKSCVGTIEMLRRLAYNIHGVMDVIDADNCEKIIKALEQEQGTAGIQAIYTGALEEGIRCAMCTNTIKSDTGCDGGCIVDAKMYNKVMTEINSRLLRKPPREGHWIDIKNKNGTVIAARCSRCGNSPKHAIKSDFCPNCGADMREGEEDGNDQ